MAAMVVAPKANRFERNTMARQLLNRLARLDVLLIDATIITTNLIYDEWKTFLGNKSMVDALLSRVRHYCHTVTITGDSLRDPQG